MRGRKFRALRGLTYLCGQRPRPYSSQGEKPPAPHSLFGGAAATALLGRADECRRPTQGACVSGDRSLFNQTGPPLRRAQWGTKRTGRWSGPRENAPGGTEDACHRGRLTVPPGPPISWVRALPTSPINHQAPHFGYAARGCGGGRVPRSKAPPQLGENGEKPGAHRVSFGSEKPRPRLSSKGRRGPPLRRGEGPRTGPPPERSRAGSGRPAEASRWLLGTFGQTKVPPPSPPAAGTPHFVRI